MAPRGPLSRAGEGWGEGLGHSGEVTPLTLSLSRTGEGTRASGSRFGRYAARRITSATVSPNEPGSGATVSP
ncbi:MAG: hypothetical protein EOO66_20275 [Methylobacterium sp.]|nr:MAG: hypothetical protein EOO66_20275 [Methylobacterium sp.]